MRFLFLVFIFFASCSIKDYIKKPESNTIEEKNTSTFYEIDLNKDNSISKEELNNYYNQNKSIASPQVDYKTPLIILFIITLMVFSLCSLTYIVDFIKSLYFYIKNLFVK
jgi:hypothetical protein